MTSKGRSITKSNHQRLPLHVDGSLLLLILLVFGGWLFSHTTHAPELRGALRVVSVDASSPGSNDKSHQNHFFAPFTDESEDTGNTGTEKDSNDREENDGPGEGIWEASYRSSLASYSNIAEALLAAATNSVRNKKTIPLFVLHRSWKSFLS